LKWRFSYPQITQINTDFIFKLKDIDKLDPQILLNRGFFYPQITQINADFIFKLKDIDKLDPQILLNRGFFIHRLHTRPPRLACMAGVGLTQILFLS